MGEGLVGGWWGFGRAGLGGVAGFCNPNPKRIDHGRSPTSRKAPCGGCSAFLMRAVSQTRRRMNRSGLAGADWRKVNPGQVA